MKKLISLLLAFALCLGLCACGSNSDECDKCEDYEKLIDYLEDEKYDSAITWILELAAEKEAHNNDGPLDVGENSPQEEEYTALVNLLEDLEESLSNDWYFSIEYTPEGSEETQWLYGSDAYLHLYERLTALGDYKDSRELASRFTLVEDVLLNVTNSYTDALGNVNESTGENYIYNAQGLLAQGPAPEEFANILWGTPNYEYDDSGRLVCLRNVNYDGAIQAILDITYNADGTVASTDFKDADGGTLTRSYVYEDGLLTQCNITDSRYSEPNFTETYTYNAAGQLERVEQAPQELDEWDDIKLTLYTYNADGTVATKRISTLSRWNGQVNGENYVHVWSYTYDGQGRVVTAVDVYEGNFDGDGNPVESYTEFDKTYTYNYGPYCVYTPVG